MDRHVIANIGAELGALEHLRLIGWAGIATLAVGVLLLSAHGGHDIEQLDRRAVGHAHRAYAQNPWAYALWLTEMP
jgi:hypothetical protein